MEDISRCVDSSDSNHHAGPQVDPANSAWLSSSWSVNSVAFLYATRTLCKRSLPICALGGPKSRTVWLAQGQIRPARADRSHPHARTLRRKRQAAHRASNPGIPQNEKVRYRRDSPFVSTSWFSRNLQSPGCRLSDSNLETTSFQVSDSPTVLTTGFADARASGGNTSPRLFRYPTPQSILLHFLSRR
jgi:hypothetical protein